MPALAEMKRQGKPISALTAYDYATSRLVDEAGIDLILVGDSLAMVVLGHDNTLAVTVDEMLHHTRAVRRAVRRALVVADMPFGSYHGTVADGVANAVRFVKEAGAEAVKIEGPARRPRPRPSPALKFPSSPTWALPRRASIAWAVTGCRPALRTPCCALNADAHRAGRCRRRGCWCSKACRAKWPPPSLPSCAIPTIGIGAGPDCDGQILVFHDLLNMTFAPPAKFVRRYADAARADPHRRGALSRRRGAPCLPLR